MALRKIALQGEPCLTKVCRPVTDFNGRLHTLLDDLADTLADSGGVGLAAPQVGVLRRVCVVLDEEDQLIELVNPEIIRTEGEQTGLEGCLSVPGKYGEVTRPEIVRVLCERHMSIGADGFMVVKKPTYGGDYKMLFFNSDGSMGEMCGNGARCICRYGFENGLAGEVQRVETTAGLVTGWRIDRQQYRVRLNDPCHIRLRGTAEVDGAVYDCAYMELGDPGIPHLTVEITDLLRRIDDEEALGALRMLGRKLRYHPALPKGANVNFYELTGPDEILEKTYERGVEDFTLACGTGTGSVAAALTLLGRVSGRNVRVRMDGGELTVDAEEKDGSIENLYLTGPAAMVCTGEILDEAILKFVKRQEEPA